MRFATVRRMGPSAMIRLAPIRTRFVLPCAFAVVTLCTVATGSVARSAEPAVARAVFVTPAGDRSAAQRAVVSAGGIPEGWVGGRLKAALQAGRARGRAPLACDRACRDRRDLVGRRGRSRRASPSPAPMRCSARGTTAAASRSSCSTRRSAPPAAWTRWQARSYRRIERQHRLSFDATYGLAGRDFNANSSRHGEFVSEIVYDMAPGADLLVHQLPHDRRVRPGRRLHRERAQAEHRRALQLVPVRPLRRHRLVRAEGERGGGGRRALGQLGRQLPHAALGGRLDGRRRRRQPRRAGRRQRLPRRARGHQPPSLRHLLGRRDQRSRQLLPPCPLHRPRADDAGAGQDQPAADPVQRPRARCRIRTRAWARARSPRPGPTTSRSGASAPRRRRT